MMASNTQQNHFSLRMNPILFENRDVQRAGWLKYIPFAEKYSANDEHKFWVVFAIYGSHTPYLEFYQKRQYHHQQHQQQEQSSNNEQHRLSIIDGPVSKHSLLNCRHITNEIIVNNNNNDKKHNEFSIILSTHIIRLSADNDEIMFDWINTIKTKLIEMKILQPTENFYIKDPCELNDQQQQQIYEPIFNLPTNQMQQLSINNSNNNNNNNNNIMIHNDYDEGPPPYEFIFSTNNQNNQNNNQRLSFREQQVEKLRKEIEQIDGIKLNLRKIDCYYNSIAFVQINNNNCNYNGIFIVGWKQKQYPYLYNTFHIGDQLLKINNQSIETIEQIKQIIKNNCNNFNSTIEFLIRRIPFGKIYCIKKNTDNSIINNDLGIKRKNGTALILNINNDSILKDYCYDLYLNYYFMNNNNHSLNQRHYQQQQQYKYWFITEINNRSLNLFYKNNEIEKRLNAIGKEISILVQPYDFIKEVKRQFKLIKNYKDYIVQ